MTILDTILKEKMKEVESLKQTLNEKQSHMRTRQEPIQSFFEKCQKTNDLQVIAEYKRASPSRGMINDGIEPEKQAKVYENAGASMMSVLTDESFFKGNFEDFYKVRKSIDIPLLNKDFIIDTIQIDRAYAYGADVILLIVAALSDKKLQELYSYAKALGLEALIEVHSKAEMLRAQHIQPEIIGVNNRDLKTFEVDLSITEELAVEMDLSSQVLVSESGLKTIDDVQRVRAAGAKAVLIGEALMKSKDPEGMIRAFQTAEPLSGDAYAG